MVRGAGFPATKRYCWLAAARAGSHLSAAGPPEPFSRAEPLLITKATKVLSPISRCEFYAWVLISPELMGLHFAKAPTEPGIDYRWYSHWYPRKI